MRPRVTKTVRKIDQKRKSVPGMSLSYNVELTQLSIQKYHYNLFSCFFHLM